MEDPSRKINVIEGIVENIVRKSNIKDEELAHELARKWSAGRI